MENNIYIEVAFATPDKQTLLSMKVNIDATVEHAIKDSGILDLHTEIDLTKNKVGIWSKTCELSDGLKNQDRIEIYRDITCDPMTARRLREKARKRASSKT